MLPTLKNTCTEENYKSLLERIFGPRFTPSMSRRRRSWANSCILTFGDFRNSPEIHMVWCGNISFSEFFKYFLKKLTNYWCYTSLHLKKKKTTEKQPEIYWRQDSSLPRYFAMSTGKQLLTYLAIQCQAVQGQWIFLSCFLTLSWRHYGVSNVGKYLPVDNTPEDMHL
jgi:hypothetical protein